MTKVSELVRQGELYLAEAGIDEPAFDARELFLAAADWTASEYALRLTEAVPVAVETLYKVYITRRSGREPLQRILGCAWFMGDKYDLNEATLIPRFDSEAVVLRAEALLKESAGAHPSDLLDVLDIGTGTGCLLISLLKAFPAAAGLGVDISERAIEAAKVNADRLIPGRAGFLRSDLFANVSGTYDIILSNPPYISSADIESLDPEVREHDPRTALDGGTDGLAFYRQIIKEAPGYLKADGHLVFEIGFDQAASVSGLMRERGFRNVTVTKDLGGCDRAVDGQI